MVRKFQANRNRKVRSALSIAVVVTVYALWNLSAVIASDAQESYDTYRYFGLIFDVQNPGITTTALFVAAGDHRLIVILLTLVSVVAWSLFAITIFYRLSYTWVRWPILFSALLFSMTAPIWSYNTVLLTESLTVSSVVLWFTALMWTTQVSKERFWRPLIGLMLSASCVILTRPQLLIVVIPTQFIFLIWVARRSSLRTPVLVSGLALVPVLVLGAYRLYQLSLVPLYQFRYALNNLVDKGSSFRPYALENMPQCQNIPAALNGPAPWNDVHALESTLMNSCPETWVWFNSDAVRAPSWLLADPMAAWLDFFGAMPRVTLALMSEGRAMPDCLSNLILNPSEPWLWMLIYAALGAIFAAIAGVRPKVTLLNIAGCAVIGIATFFYLIMMWASDGYDVNRHIYPVLPLMAVAFMAIPATMPRTVSRDGVLSATSKCNAGVL